MNDDCSLSGSPAAAATLRRRLAELRVLSAEGFRVLRVFATIHDAIFAVGGSRRESVRLRARLRRERGPVFWAASDHLLVG